MPDQLLSTYEPDHEKKRAKAIELAALANFHISNGFPIKKVTSKMILDDNGKSATTQTARKASINGGKTSKALAASERRILRIADNDF